MTCTALTYQQLIIIHLGNQKLCSVERKEYHIHKYHLDSGYNVLYKCRYYKVAFKLSIIIHGWTRMNLAPYLLHECYLILNYDMNNITVCLYVGLIFNKTQHECAIG